MMVVGAALWMMGCSTDDVTKEGTPQNAVAISFGRVTEGDYGDYETYRTYGTYRTYETYETNGTNGTNGTYDTRAVIGHDGAMNSEDLHYTGFGVFASQSADAQPDLMYNQEVEFTFVGDLSDPLKGYWSYSPIKYWPADPASLTELYFCAYAPYVDKATADTAGASDTGIVGMSSNTDTTPYITYRRSLKPDENVDLLWCYYTGLTSRTALQFNMHHALARVKVNVKLAEALPADTKVLIEDITLRGEMTKTAKLILNDETVVEGNHIPTWQALEPADTEDRTILIDNKDMNESSYGIIDAPIRYIAGLPYAWQPAGLTTTAQNALSTGDRPTFIYLIPQSTALSLTVQVKYHKMTAAGADTEGTKTTEAALTTVANPLRGNTTYTLNLTLSGI